MQTIQTAKHEECEETVTMTVFCPVCRHETFVVTVTGGGSYVHPDIGTVYWFEGDGECPCGHKGYYSDSSA